jgi:hypothetical protein
MNTLKEFNIAYTNLPSATEPLLDLKNNSVKLYAITPVTVTKNKSINNGPVTTTQELCFTFSPVKNSSKQDLGVSGSIVDGEETDLHFFNLIESSANKIVFYSAAGNANSGLNNGGNPIKPSNFDETYITFLKDSNGNWTKTVRPLWVKKQIQFALPAWLTRLGLSPEALCAKIGVELISLNGFVLNCFITPQRIVQDKLGVTSINQVYDKTQSINTYKTSLPTDLKAVFPYMWIDENGNIVNNTFINKTKFTDIDVSTLTNYSGLAKCSFTYILRLHNKCYQTGNEAQNLQGMGMFGQCGLPLQLAWNDPRINSIEKVIDTVNPGIELLSDKIVLHYDPSKPALLQLEITSAPMGNMYLKTWATSSAIDIVDGELHYDLFLFAGTKL